VQVEESYTSMRKENQDTNQSYTDKTRRNKNVMNLCQSRETHRRMDPGTESVAIPLFLNTHVYRRELLTMMISIWSWIATVEYGVDC
jgi:hypothetical protein